jgi:hypothetical protein
MRQIVKSVIYWGMTECSYKVMSHLNLGIAESLWVTNNVDQLLTVQRIDAP